MASNRSNSLISTKCGKPQTVQKGQKYTCKLVQKYFDSFSNELKLPRPWRLKWVEQCGLRDLFLRLIIMSLGQFKKTTWYERNDKKNNFNISKRSMGIFFKKA